MFVFRDPALEALLHARGEPATVASAFLAVTDPTMPMTVDMALSGVLRAVGDARRAMFVTLAGASSRRSPIRC